MPVPSFVFFVFFTFGRDAINEHGACIAWVRRVFSDAEQLNASYPWTLFPFHLLGKRLTFCIYSHAAHDLVQNADKLLLKAQHFVSQHAHFQPTR